MKKTSFIKTGHHTIMHILGFILLISSAYNANAQEKIDTYSMNVLGNYDYNNFNISLDDDKALWIDAYATYIPGTKCGLKIEKFLQSDFIYTLQLAKEQYSEWKKVSIENDITDVKMKMEQIFATEGYFSYLNSLKHDKNVKVIFAFTYFKEDYVLIMNLEKMTASDNENISFDGTSVIFNSEEEIYHFITKISEDPEIKIKATLETTEP